jgi:hypothetical protein
VRVDGARCVIDVTSRMLRATCQMVHVVWTLPRHTSASDSPSACADGGGRGSLKRLAMPNLYLPPNRSCSAREALRPRLRACVRGFVDMRVREGPSAAQRRIASRASAASGQIEPSQWARSDEQSSALLALDFSRLPADHHHLLRGRDAGPPHRRTAARSHGGRTWPSSDSPSSIGWPLRPRGTSAASHSSNIMSTCTHA